MKSSEFFTLQNLLLLIAFPIRGRFSFWLLYVLVQTLESLKFPLPSLPLHSRCFLKTFAYQICTPWSESNDFQMPYGFELYKNTGILRWIEDIVRISAKSTHGDITFGIPFDPFGKIFKFRSGIQKRGLVKFYRYHNSAHIFAEKSSFL